MKESKKIALSFCKTYQIARIRAFIQRMNFNDSLKNIKTTNSNGSGNTF